MESDGLREAVARRAEENARRAATEAADLEYARGQARRLSESMEHFLNAMRAAGNKGLERLSDARWTGKKSWNGWIFPDGTASSHGVRSRVPFAIWAEQTLSDRGPRASSRPGDGDRFRVSVDHQVRSFEQRLASILATHEVSPLT